VESGNKMTWNYRIIKHDENENVWFAVHEVFYNYDNTIMGYTQDPISIVGDDAGDCITTANMIIRDLERLPVLTESQISVIEFVDDYVDDVENMTLEELEKEFGTDE